MRPRPSSPFQIWLRVLLGVLGAASFAAGVAAVFITENGTGTGVLIALGGVLLVLALLGDRVESFEFGGSKLKMRAAAAEKFTLAEDSENRGDTETATLLRAEARALLEAAGPIASEYRAVRGSTPAGQARTRALERTVARARRLAVEQSFEPGEVVRWLRDGSEEERITALAMMQAKPALRDFGAALAAIKDRGARSSSITQCSWPSACSETSTPSRNGVRRRQSEAQGACGSGTTATAGGSASGS